MTAPTLPICGWLRATNPRVPRDGEREKAIKAADTIEALYEALQQFVNGVETHMIDSPADETLANVTNRANRALTLAREGAPHDKQ